MHRYYCKNCINIVVKWHEDDESYYFLSGCYNIISKKFNTIKFLDCIHCDKFVGIKCLYVCTNCFGEDEIFGEENLFNFFLKYKKTLEKYHDFNYLCKNCDNKKFRSQHWFFEELTFYKQ